MGEYIIKGGEALSGEIVLSGSKNSALPVIAASILTGGAIVHNCPRLSDTHACMDILRELGCSCSLVGNTLICEPYNLDSYSISPELCGKMRSSVTFLGALLGRTGQGEIYSPGGCELGSRPIDIHLEALTCMGVRISCEGDKILCTGKPKGADLTLRYPSVGATENIILAAVLAEGTTVISNCAKEPEIRELIAFLNGAGAKIYNKGEGTIVIEGVKALDRCEHTLMYDRIEAGTYLCAAAATGGELFIRGIKGELIAPVIGLLREMGCIIKESRGLIYIDAPKRLQGDREIITGPYPAMPTDMQPQLSAVLAMATGESRVRERVFDGRIRHIGELNKMGAQIKPVSNREFVIEGVEKLHGVTVEARDLRGGAALIIAGLGAQGSTIVKNPHFIQRGYEHIEKKLAQVGADIKYRG